MSDRLPFDPSAMVARLVTEGVDFVIIGGLAATLQGAELPTLDLDISYDRSLQNLERLASALQDLEVRLRGAEDVPIHIDALFLRNGEIWTFRSSVGNIDCLANPTGAPPYDQLKERAVKVALGPHQVKIANLDDLIAMKGTTGRDKDVMKLAELIQLRQLIQENEHNPR